MANPLERKGVFFRQTLSPLPRDPVDAMAYVPFQQWAEIYSAEEALQQGTLFPVLDKPFCGRRVNPHA